MRFRRQCIALLCVWSLSTVALTTAVEQFPAGAADRAHQSHHKSIVGAESQGQGQPSVLSQLSTTYDSAGASMTIGTHAFTVGIGSIGRGTSLDAVQSAFAPTPNGAQYGGSGVAESFAPKSGGVEQTFQIATAPGGDGDLLIDIPVSGLTLAKYGTSIDLLDPNGMSVAELGQLTVTDATGAHLPSTLGVAASGDDVTIDIDDSSAVYPILVDPTWTGTLFYPAESPDWSETVNSVGMSSAIYDTTAVVGSPGYPMETMPVTTNNDAYVFTETTSSWSLAQDIVPPSDVGTSDDFGNSVAITGSGGDAEFIAIGDPEHTVGSNANQGDVYIYSYSGSTWSETAELTAPSGDDADAANAYFGSSVALSGDTLVVGAPYATVGSNAQQGAAYIYSWTGSTWSGPAQITASDGAAGTNFGWSVTTDASTTLVGAPGVSDNGTGSAVPGTVYDFAGPGTSWTQEHEITVRARATALILGVRSPSRMTHLRRPSLAVPSN
jgi:trimeric autotransporter adhesin